MFNKKLFIDLAFEQELLDNRLGNTFIVVGRGNIVKAFNENRSPNKFLQFRTRMLTKD